MPVAIAPDVATLNAFTPAEGLDLPGLKAPSLDVHFDAKGLPDFVSTHGYKVEPTRLTDLLPGEPIPAGNDLRMYRLTGPIGTAAALFARGEENRLVIAADAFETVSGRTEDRRSKPVYRFQDLSDPRPPVFEPDTWRLIWTGRPNGANFAAARISRPKLSSTSPKAAGFHLWRASEASVVDLGITARFGPSLPPSAQTLRATIQNERNRPLRLQMIRGLVGPLLFDAQFRREFVNLFAAVDTELHPNDVVVELPGKLAGVEFFMYTAMSKTGMSTDKTELNHLVAVAVPQAHKVSQPSLRVFTGDANGGLATSGCCLALVGTDAETRPEDIRLFWDDRSVAGSDDVTHQLTSITILTLRQAEKYLPGIEEAGKRLGRARIHALLVKSPSSWAQQSFAVDVRSELFNLAEEQATSPRSDVVHTLVAPGYGPQLSLQPRTSSVGEYVVKQQGLFTQRHGGSARL